VIDNHELAIDNHELAIDNHELAIDNHELAINNNKLFDKSNRELIPLSIIEFRNDFKGKESHIIAIGGYTNMYTTEKPQYILVIIKSENMDTDEHNYGDMLIDYTVSKQLIKVEIESNEFSFKKLNAKLYGMNCYMVSLLSNQKNYIHSNATLHFNEKIQFRYLKIYTIGIL